MALQGVEENYDARPTRLCMSCGQSDKAPRDQVALSDGNVALYHKDCHAMLGCEICKKELELVAKGHGPKGLKNETLWLAIVDAAFNPETPTPDLYTDKDATGNYQKAIDNGEMIDTTWEGGNK